MEIIVMEIIMISSKASRCSLESYTNCYVELNSVCLSPV